MKLITILFLFCTSAFYSTAQTTGKLIVTPGLGIGAIKLGMTEAAVAKILKGTTTAFDFETEKASYKEDEIAIMPQFKNGFDKCLKYMQDLPGNYPVFALYFKKDKLNYITITSYGAEKSLTGKVAMKNGVKFLMPMDKCVKLLGKDYIDLPYGDYTGDHIYNKIGLETTYDKTGLTVLAIFTKYEVK